MRRAGRVIGLLLGFALTQLVAREPPDHEMNLTR